MRYLILLIFVVGTVNSVNAQFFGKKKKKTIDTVFIAQELVSSENFENAINLYKKLLYEEPENPEFNFELGFCYLNTPSKRDKSIQYFRKARNLRSKKSKRGPNIDYFEASYYLAMAYRVNYMYDSALTILYDLSNKFKSQKLKEAIKHEIRLCEDGKYLYSNPVDIKVTNLGEIINSKYGDYGPVISADESLLLFTSRRPTKGAVKGYDGAYDENIFMAIKDEQGKWQTPIPVTSLNTTDHEATISLSPDGSKLFIYKGEDEGSIYVSTLMGETWSKPRKLGDNINTRYRETHASLSSDGKKLYFTSDRPGGLGGLDIYVSELQKDGTWGKPVNLGRPINTPEDEDGVFIQADGKTLYFSSKGHGGLGGFDIFKAELSSFGTWSEPVNLGYPINSVEDDIFYNPIPSGERAYFASQKDYGLGKTDIYMMGLPEQMKTNLTIMTGKVRVCSGDLPESIIYLKDNTTGESLEIRPNSKTGKFIIIAKRGHKYTLEIVSNKKIVFKDEFKVDMDAPPKKLYKIIRLDPDKPCDMKVTVKAEDLLDPKKIDENGRVYDEYVEIDNILFPSGKATSIPDNKSLNALAKYLTNNPEAIIEIGAYADAKGNASYNYELSRKRGEIVKKYLVKRGVNPKQLVVVAYGEENPITLNKFPNGKWNPEGQKYNRRIEFRIIAQGDDSLLIRPLSDFPEKLKSPYYDPNYKKDPNKHIEINY